MVYRMTFKVDGGCRNNGLDNAYGAAACCLMQPGGRGDYQYRTECLPNHTEPTNQRAELLAIILALEWALDRYEQLDGTPYMMVSISSDSRYALDCLTNWKNTWIDNGWVNSRGDEVANRDLIEEALDLGDEVCDLGELEYCWIPRSWNQEADWCCNEAMDEMWNGVESDW